MLSSASHVAVARWNAYAFPYMAVLLFFGFRLLICHSAVRLPLRALSIFRLLRTRAQMRFSCATTRFWNGEASNAARVCRHALDHALYGRVAHDPV